MNVPRSIFRQYDVRGLVGAELTPDLARGLGRAYATLGWERMGRAPVLAVGRDNRPSGRALSGAVTALCCSTPIRKRVECFATASRSFDSRATFWTRRSA